MIGHLNQMPHNVTILSLSPCPAQTLWATSVSHRSQDVSSLPSVTVSPSQLDANTWQGVVVPRQALRICLDDASHTCKLIYNRYLAHIAAIMP